MSGITKFPVMHTLLESIPYPGASWTEVTTTHPSFYHLHWALFFAFSCAFLNAICRLLTKRFAPSFMGYSFTPPLPHRLKSMLHKNDYIKIGEACNYTQMMDIKQYDLDHLSSKYGYGFLSPKEIEQYLQFCNKHHLEIQKNEQRFQECLFPIIMKSFTLGLGIYSVYDKEWLYDRSAFYRDWPYNQQLDKSIDIKLLYMLHIGFYIYKLFAQVFLDRHLKDFMSQIIHHVTTIILMTLSYTLGLVRVGVAVLLLHDPSDICLHGAKLMRLVHQQLLMNILFACLVVSWFVTRILIYPYHCVLSGFVDFYEQHGNRNHRQDMMVMLGCILMCALYVLHLHWFYLIMKAVIRTVNSGEAADPRSDEEDDSDNGSNENK